MLTPRMVTAPAALAAACNNSAGKALRPDSRCFCHDNLSCSVLQPDGEMSWKAAGSPFGSVLVAGTVDHLEGSDKIKLIKSDD
jgi:hypothetical protein